MSAISIRNLDVVFGDNVDTALNLLDQGKTRQEILAEGGAVVGVHDASIEVAEGEICVLMGLSGSGKSSLMRAVNGLNPISRGELLVKDGERMVNMADCDATTLRHMRTHRVSMVFQKFALMPWLTVLDNVAFGLEMQGIGKQERREKAMEKLEMVGLDEWKDKYPHELSGGMQQRVGLARAFAMDSDILLMDEPFSALDPLIRAQLQDELIELQQRLNKTILFVSHDLDEALKIGTHIAIMESARVIQHGTPEDIVLNPRTPYVEAFVAHTNPLNVLRGKSLMTRLEQFNPTGDRFVLCEKQNTNITLNAERQVVSAASLGRNLELTRWQEGDNPDQLRDNTMVVTCADVSMKHAVEITYRTGMPVLLEQAGQLVGVLSDKELYHALLGKRFKAA